MLVGHGADPSTTSDVLYNFKPPLIVATEEGSLLAMQCLVEEQGQVIQMQGPHGGIVEAACKEKL